MARGAGSVQGWARRRWPICRPRCRFRDSVWFRRRASVDETQWGHRTITPPVKQRNLSGDRYQRIDRPQGECRRYL